LPRRLFPANYPVVAITDGDTIKVIMDGEQVKIRLHGIDAPEKKQAYGQAARDYAVELAGGEHVRLIGHGKDRYGRLIAEVILPDGRSMNHEMVSDGYAWWYRKYAPNDKALEEAEARARSKRRGLWADDEPVAPWEWRKR